MSTTPNRIHHAESRIRSASKDDAKAIADIYNYYVENTSISFEESAVSEATMAERVASVTAKLPWLLCEIKFANDWRVAGYAYASPYHSRVAYRFSVETTVYLQQNYCAQGIGSQLYAALLQQLQPLGVHSCIAAIALPNENSVRLHEKFGFAKVGHFNDIGFKFNRWIDVGYWQKTL